MLLLIMSVLVSAYVTLVVLGYALVVAAVYRCVREAIRLWVEKPCQPTEALRAF